MAAQIPHVRQREMLADAERQHLTAQAKAASPAHSARPARPGCWTACGGGRGALPWGWKDLQRGYSCQEPGVSVVTRRMALVVATFRDRAAGA